MKPLPFKLNLESDMEKYRAETFWTKEPETIAWIEGFKENKEPWKGCSFFDVGANIGLYSLYAASLYPQLIIIAFEPQLENFIALCENIKLNGFNHIIPVFGGFGAETKIGTFEQRRYDRGSSTGNYIDADIDCQSPWNNNFWRLCLTFNLNAFCSFFGIPEYLKIDVDGAEYNIIGEALNTVFKNDILKACLIEFDITDKQKANMYVSAIRDCGFSFINKYQKMENHSNVRREKENIKVENIIFTR